MQNLYEPPDSELKPEKPEKKPAISFFLSANSGFFTIPAIVIPLLFYSGGFSYSGINLYDIFGLFVVSAGCSLLACLLLLPLRKKRWYWVAMAGSLLSIFFCFVLVFFDEL